MRGDYSKGKIYKIEPICEHEDDEVYYGSTTKQYLSHRMDHHRSDYKLWKDKKRNSISVFIIFDKYGVENCKIHLIEDFPCERKDQLEAREAYYQKNNPCVNKHIARRTYQEYYLDKKDTIRQKHKQYYEENKEAIALQSKKMREENPENNKKKCKQYYHTHREQQLIKLKVYRDKNKEEFNNKRKEKFQCECGSILRFSDKAQHCRSIKHKEYEKNRMYHIISKGLDIIRKLDKHFSQ